MLIFSQWELTSINNDSVQRIKSFWVKFGGLELKGLITTFLRWGFKSIL